MSDERNRWLSGCGDGQLAELIKGGDSEAFAELTERYIPMVRAKVSPFRTGGMETEDLCQEGLLGLLLAAKTFDRKNGAAFRTYADVCVSNRVIMAYRSAMGKKNRPLSNFVSLSGEDVPEFPADCSADPETMLDDRENFEAICRRITKILTPMELRALHLYLGGYSYREIAQKMSVTEKAADNALQRARGKLKHEY